jgi:alkanesulfonate monooxygenase SsuD/methylene tetrahydromethanopterin reductase-like flavin-dependent oxidoreductase (luciferase family)
MIFLLPTVPATRQEREEMRPIGRNREKYQQMIEEVREIAQICDDIGMNVLSTTEHHFHSEGFEMSIAPLLLYTDLAARTKNLHFSSLGLVLPSWDPLRAAEELAVLDHLTQGRAGAGFARGYQDRWVNVLGQNYHVTGAPMDGSAIDNHNRAVYEEMYRIIKKAWTEDSITHEGKYYQVPYPRDGVARWPVADFTRACGAPGEVDENGVVKRISVVPAPYTEPHPKLFQPFSVSENTIKFTAEEDITPWILVSYPEEFVRLCHVYQDVAEKNGRSYGLGQNVGAFRSIHIGDTEEEAVNLLRQTNYYGFQEWFAGFGFWEGLRSYADDERFPRSPTYTPLPPEEHTVERMRNVKYALSGTPDQVKREIDDLRKLYGEEGAELEWLGYWCDQGLMSMDDTRRQLELFGKHVIEEFKD